MLYNSTSLDSARSAFQQAKVATHHNELDNPCQLMPNQPTNRPPNQPTNQPTHPPAFLPHVWHCSSCPRIQHAASDQSHVNVTGGSSLINEACVDRRHHSVRSCNHPASKSTHGKQSCQQSTCPVCAHVLFATYHPNSTTDKRIVITTGHLYKLP